MDAATLLALTKFNAGTQVRDKVRPGKYEVDCLVRVAGVMKVGKDYDSAISAAVPWKQLAAVLFSKLNGVTVEAVVREALAANETDSETVTKAAQAAVDKIVGSTERPCKGKVNVKEITIQGVELVTEEAA